MEKPEIEIIEEITPFHNIKNIYIEEREKKKFDFPVHTHYEMEINLSIGCRGAMRVVGDSLEEIGDMDMTLVGSNLAHGWLQHNCKAKRIKEITIQFVPEFFSLDYLKLNNLNSMYMLLEKSSRGVTFDYETILENYAYIKAMLSVNDQFERIMLLTRIFNNLSKAETYRVLASESFSENPSVYPSRRITKIQQYINAHYTEQIDHAALADMADMTLQSFAKFFKKSTGRTVGQFILEVRMGVASRLLINTRKSISEICYECGFNNVSHFCRTFRGYKGYSPGEFRQEYKGPIA